MFRSKFLRHFYKGNVSPGFNRSQKNDGPGLDPMGAAIATLPQRVLSTARTPFRLEAETPERSAITRRVMPEEIAPMARPRRSDDNNRVMIAGPLPGNQDESDFVQ
ncbi:hypothetical protein [Kozakia baliensis]|nr:hypothetical protein [Kozakia baliensis]